MDIKIAAACIVWRNNDKKEVGLIHRRSDFPHHLSDKWFFPGGIIEVDEQPSEAAIRETKEECGLSVSNPQLVDTYAYTEYWQDMQEVDREQRVILVVYQAICADDNELSNSDETQGSAWVPLIKIKDYLTADTVSTHTSKAVRELLGI
jgi:8-oxo-dGTP pyrophosphatase MutT (NUDIX family)